MDSPRSAPSRGGKDCDPGPTKKIIYLTILFSLLKLGMEKSGQPSQPGTILDPMHEKNAIQIKKNKKSI